jgi:hypothetical protein
VTVEEGTVSGCKESRAARLSLYITADHSLRVLISDHEYRSVVYRCTCLLPPKPAYSQGFLFGVKVAGQITNTFTNPALPQIVHEDRTLFGPTAELRLGRRFSLEVDALYRPKLNYTDHLFFLAPLLTENRVTTDVTTHSWEIPVLIKWRPPIYHNSLLVAAGFSGRYVAGIEHSYGTASTAGFPTTTFDDRTSDGVMVNHWTYGPVVAAGLDIRARKFHFQPELRYTR